MGLGFQAWEIKVLSFEEWKVVDQFWSLSQKQYSPPSQRSQWKPRGRSLTVASGILQRLRTSMRTCLLPWSEDGGPLTLFWAGVQRALEVKTYKANHQLRAREKPRETPEATSELLNTQDWQLSGDSHSLRTSPVPLSDLTLLWFQWQQRLLPCWSLLCHGRNALRRLMNERGKSTRVWVSMACFYRRNHYIKKKKQHDPDSTQHTRFKIYIPTCNIVPSNRIRQDFDVTVLETYYCTDGGSSRGEMSPYYRLKEKRSFVCVRAGLKGQSLSLHWQRVAL